MLPVKLITFDVTGTLLFFKTPLFEKYAELALKFGIEADCQLLKKNFKEAWIALNEAHPNFGKDTGLGWENWWTGIVEKTFSGYVEPEEKHKATEMAKDLIKFFTTKEAFTVYPGAIDLLEHLRTKSLLGVISNYDPRLYHILEAMDLKKYFNFVLTSYEVGYPKPDARIFHEALTLGNCSLAEEALHVGNDIVTDFLGAKKAGLRAVLINLEKENLNSCKVQKNEVFENFNELKAYFEGVKF